MDANETLLSRSTSADAAYGYMLGLRQYYIKTLQIFPEKDVREPANRFLIDFSVLTPVMRLSKTAQVVSRKR